MASSSFNLDALKYKKQLELRQKGQISAGSVFKSHSDGNLVVFNVPPRFKDTVFHFNRSDLLIMLTGPGRWKQTNQRGGPHCCEICCAPPPRWWAPQTPAWQRCIPSSPALLLLTPGHYWQTWEKHSSVARIYQSEKLPKSDPRKLRGRFLVSKLQPRINGTVKCFQRKADAPQTPSYGSPFIHNQLVMTRPTLQLYSK